MADTDIIEKHGKVKTLIIVGLIAFIIYLFWTNSLSKQTQDNVWTTLTIFGIGAGIYYFLIMNKSKAGMYYRIQKEIADTEYIHHGRQLEHRYGMWDKLTENELVFGFDIGEESLSYIWDMKNNMIVSRIDKNMSMVKQEYLANEIKKAIAMESIKQGKYKKSLEERGLDVPSEEYTYEEEEE